MREAKQQRRGSVGKRQRDLRFYMEDDRKKLEGAVLDHSGAVVLWFDEYEFSRRVYEESLPYVGER